VGPTGPKGSAPYAVTVGGTLTTALPQPLYPISVSFGNPMLVTVMSPLGYFANLTSTSDPTTSVPSYGDIQGGTTANYVGPGCTGDVWLNAASFQPGQVVRAGTPAQLYYIPRNATVAIPAGVNPNRGSRSSGSITPNCESPAASPALTGHYYRGLPHVPATTGFGLSVSGNGVIQFDYVP